VSLSAAALPYVAAGAFVAGLAAATVPWWWFHGVRMDQKQLAIDLLTGAVAKAEIDARRKAADAQRQVDQFNAALEVARNTQEAVHVEVIREIQVAASPDRQCLGPAAVGVLQRAKDRRDAPRADPGEPAGTGLRLAPYPVGSASERAVAEWMEAALDQYTAVRDRHRALAGTVRTLPCVEVVE
jgi:hypothetical protein